MLEVSLADVALLYRSVGARLDAYPDRESSSYRSAHEAFDRASVHYHLVKEGHGVHNPEFAEVLIDVALENLEAAEALIESPGR